MCLPYIVEITFECVCRREDEDHADHPRHGFARADRRIAQHRHGLKAENRFADQFHRAANQRRGGCADLRKRRVAEQVARDGGIREVVDLLKQIAAKERQESSEASGFL